MEAMAPEAQPGPKEADAGQGDGGGAQEDPVQAALSSVDQGLSATTQLFQKAGAPEEIVAGMAKLREQFQMLVQAAFDSAEGGEGQGQPEPQGAQPVAMQDPGGGRPMGPQG